jgi:hypothetical protein
MPILMHILQLDQAASRDFAALLTAIPELVEAYEGANAAGATVRRYAIINEDNQVLLASLCECDLNVLPSAASTAMVMGLQLQVTIDAAVSAPPQQHPPHSTAGLPKAGVVGGSSSQDGQLGSADAALSSRPAAQLQLGTAQAELTWLRRRYGDDMQVHPPAERDAAAAPSVAAEQRDAHHQPHQQETHRCAVQFSVSVTPTDPNWQSGPLRIHIQLDGNYPAAHSVAVTSVEGCQQADSDRGSSAGNGDTHVASSSAPQLSAGVLQMLAKLLSAQAAANASRPAPLKALLRSLENNAAVFVQQAR